MTGAGGLAALLSVALAAAPTTPAASGPSPEEPAWLITAEAYVYLLSGEGDYAQPEVSLDRGWLHLEVRYNYEDLYTASGWIGYNFHFGKKLTLDITPIAGVVQGDTDGVALGYEGALDWWKLELSSEGELVLDTDDHADSFVYTWSELTIAPWDWLQAGLVWQQTDPREGDRDVQRGFLLGFTLRDVTFLGYVFNPDRDDTSYALAVILELGPRKRG